MISISSYLIYLGLTINTVFIIISTYYDSITQVK